MSGFRIIEGGFGKYTDKSIRDQSQGVSKTRQEFPAELAKSGPSVHLSSDKNAALSRDVRQGPTKLGCEALFRPKKPVSAQEYVSMMHEAIKEAETEKGLQQKTAEPYEKLLAALQKKHGLKIG